MRGQHWRSDNYRCAHCKGGSQVLEDERKREEAEQKEAASKEYRKLKRQSLQDSEDTLM